MKIAYITNGVIRVYNKPPKSWVDPVTGTPYTGFDNNDLAFYLALGFKEVIEDPEPEYDPIYEIMIENRWDYDPLNDQVYRKYTITDRSLYDVQEDRYNAVREECRGLILEVINEDQQRNLAMGILPDIGYTTWIADMRIESNRCEELYIEATTINDVKAVVWNFPEFVEEV